MIMFFNNKMLHGLLFRDSLMSEIVIRNNTYNQKCLFKLTICRAISLSSSVFILMSFDPSLITKMSPKFSLLIFLVGRK